MSKIIDLVNLQIKFAKEDISDYKAMAAKFIKSAPISDDIVKERDTWLENFIYYHCDEVTLELFEKSKPDLTDDQKKFLSEYPDSDSFFKKYAKLAVLSSFASHKKYETTSFSFNQVQITLALNESSFKQRTTYFTHEIYKTILMRTRSDLKVYWTNNTSLVAFVRDVVLDPNYISTFALELNATTTQDQKNAAISKKVNLINLIDPTGQVSSELVKEASAMGWYYNFKGVKAGCKPISDMVDEMVKQIVKGIEEEGVKNEYKETLDGLLAEYANIGAFQVSLSKGILAMLERKVDVKASYAANLEEAVELLTSKVTKNATKFPKLNALGKVLFVTAIGIITIYGLTNWEKLNAFQKGLMVVNSFIFFVQVSVLLKNGITAALGYAARQFGSQILKISYEKMVQFSTRLTRLVAAFIPQTLLKYSKLFIPMVNIAFVGYMCLELLWNIHKGKLDAIGIALAVVEIFVSFVMALVWDATGPLGAVVIGVCLGILVAITLFRFILSLVGIGEKSPFQRYCESITAYNPKFLVSGDIKKEKSIYYMIKMLQTEKTTATEARRTQIESVFLPMWLKMKEVNDKSSTLTAAVKNQLHNQMDLLVAADWSTSNDDAAANAA
ncbi:hypothetical protein DLAC_03619 [Tieghemostelium lacteum]|uniref:Uncharacterized protein n=1 Tax=Tieghemostelium lacteum TaxID=361077 RepID=A0A152A098_TIELA|nr:hypothetical protein DLAC_03619 [Tieghemostelium lacteum]|eukprot:KYQ99681.1 hypothetical protein DLAC_03619 [Tieghemostelium lacteum]